MAILEDWIYRDRHYTIPEVPRVYLIERLS